MLIHNVQHVIGLIIVKKRLLSDTIGLGDLNLTFCMLVNRKSPHTLSIMSHHLRKFSYETKAISYKIKEEILCAGKWVGLKRVVYHNPRGNERVRL